MPATRKELLFAAISNKKIRLAVSLLENGVDPNVVNHMNQTPVMVAANLEKNDFRAHFIRVLLNHEANVNKRDCEGRTVLMYGCSQLDRDDVVRLVVRTGRCDPNITDSYGDTALIHAVSCGNAPVIRILVNSAFTKHCLHVDLQNAEGVTPLQLALLLEQRDCVRVLVTEGKADIRHVRDKDKLFSMLNPDPLLVSTPHVSDAHPGGPRLDVPCCSNSSPAASSTSLKLERISIHSRRSSSSEDREFEPLEARALLQAMQASKKGGTPKRSKPKLAPPSKEIPHTIHVLSARVDPEQGPFINTVAANLNEKKERSNSSTRLINAPQKDTVSQPPKQELRRRSTTDFSQLKESHSLSAELPSRCQSMGSTELSKLRHVREGRRKKLQPLPCTFTLAPPDTVSYGERTVLPAISDHRRPSFVSNSGKE